MNLAAENREVFDAAALGQAITFRHWQPGDRFQPIGQDGTAKLQDLFVNQKVPREERHQRIVAETGMVGCFGWRGCGSPSRSRSPSLPANCSSSGLIDRFAPVSWREWRRPNLSRPVRSPGG